MKTYLQNVIFSSIYTLVSLLYVEYFLLKLVGGKEGLLEVVDSIESLVPKI